MTDNLRKSMRQATQAYQTGSQKEKQEILTALQAAGQKWLPDSRFNEQYELGKKIASQRGDDELTMQFYLHGTSEDNGYQSKDDEVVLPCIFASWEPESDQQKLYTMMGIGTKFADAYPQHMLTTVVQVSEAWAVRHDKADNVDLSTVPLPSQDPKRMEVVLVNALSMDNRRSIWTAEIHKNNSGKFTGLKTVIEDRYTPGKPQLEENIQSHLSTAVFVGYTKAKMAGRED